MRADKEHLLRHGFASTRVMPLPLLSLFLCTFNSTISSLVCLSLSCFLPLGLRFVSAFFASSYYFTLSNAISTHRILYLSLNIIYFAIKFYLLYRSCACNSIVFVKHFCTQRWPYAHIFHCPRSQKFLVASIFNICMKRYIYDIRQQATALNLCCVYTLT